MYITNKTTECELYNIINTSSHICLKNWYNNTELFNVNILKYENGEISDNIKEDIKLSISMPRYILLYSLLTIKRRYELSNSYILGLKYNNFNDIQFLVSGSQKNNEHEKDTMIRELNEELYLTLNNNYNYYLLYSGFIINKSKQVKLYNLNIKNCHILKNININETNNIGDIYTKKVSTLLHGTKEDFMNILENYKKKNITIFNDDITGIYIIKLDELINKLINIDI